MIDVIAHGIGARGDLPLPVGALVAGAAAAIIISFAVLAKSWKISRFAELARGRDLGSTTSAPVRIFVAGGRVVGTVIVVTAIGSALFVADNTVENIAPRIVYVLLWVVIPLLSFVMGDVWRWLSPFEAVASLRDRMTHRELSTGGGAPLYAAAAALLVFQWLELAYHEPAAARVLAALLIAWCALSLHAAATGGTELLRSRDPLAVWCRLIASVSPVFVREGRFGVRMPFVGLAEVPIRPGIAAVVLVVLGGTTFDGVTRTDTWADVIGTSVEWSATLINTVGLLMVIAVLFVLYLGCIRLMQRAAQTDNPTYDDVFALALLPVAVGYSIAHYFSLAVFEGQFLMIQASDPFGQRWDLFGTRTDYVNYTAVSTTAVAWLQALGIIVGHLAGVLVGHDRAVAELPERNFERSQQPLVALMVAMTCFGLLLLVEA